jgi:uncharacterized protein YcfJ
MRTRQRLKQVLPVLLLTPALVLAAAGADARGRGYDVAQVVHAEPIYRTVRHAVPREECHLREVAYREAGPGGGATAPVLGAIIGGAVGNAVGRNKSNKRVGAVAGAALGGSIGYDMSWRSAARHGEAVHYRTERVCSVVTHYQEVARVDGYHVTYRYRGDTYTTRMPYDPGKQLRVRVHVEPVI